jgi:hypothetical protein
VEAVIVDKPLLEERKKWGQGHQSMIYVAAAQHCDDVVLAVS